MRWADVNYGQVVIATFVYDKDDWCFTATFVHTVG